MTETAQEIIWRLEQQCIALRERAERAERKVARLETALVESNIAADVIADSPLAKALSDERNADA